METYGSSESNTFMIADQQEAWYLESYSGHQWCAVKMPEDAVAVFGNECMLGSVADYVEGESLLPFRRAVLCAGSRRSDCT